MSRRFVVPPARRTLATVGLVLWAGAAVAQPAAGPQQPAVRVQAATAPAAPQPAAPPVDWTRIDDGPGGIAPKSKGMHILRAQVLLDRAGFSPGVIDGAYGNLLEHAIRGFQTASGLPATGKMDPATWEKLNQPDVPAVVTLRIADEDAKQRFVKRMPSSMMAKAKLRELGYTSLAEALAEKFHTTPATLAQLNPGVKFIAGAEIRVPNVRVAAPRTAELNPEPVAAEPAVEGAEPLTPEQIAARQAAKARWLETLDRLSVSPEQPRAVRVMVDGSDRLVRAFDAEGRLIAQFPATIGSHRDPLPIGNWRVTNVATLPSYNYNPKLFWDARKSDRPAVLNPGPNNPVGVVWLALSKRHYGIHGTPEPAAISRTASHGCIRLTNWDAAKLAQMIEPGTPAVLQR